jgi:hypothetical protein
MAKTGIKRASESEGGHERRERESEKGANQSLIITAGIVNTLSMKKMSYFRKSLQAE